MSLSATQPQVFPAPFDAIAARYDEAFTSSSIGRAQRAAVWEEFATAFRGGDRILEIGCGTGVDACFLAGRGVEVLACDPSSEMIAVAARRIRQNGLQTLVRTQVLRAEEISTLRSGELFDGAFSNFGALNCVSDLAGLARNLARLLRPGATVLFCWMGPSCLWEIVWYLGRGSKSKAFRRLRKNGVRAAVADKAFIDVHYPSVRRLARIFAPQFRLQLVRGIGITVPPSYLELWAQRYPQWLRLCESADSCIARWPGFRMLGDHVLVRLQRTSREGI